MFTYKAKLPVQLNTYPICFTSETFSLSKYVPFLFCSCQCVAIIISGSLLNDFVLTVCVSSSQKFMVGLNFANEREATQFFKAVDAKVNERQEKRASEFG